MAAAAAAAAVPYVRLTPTNFLVPLSPSPSFYSSPFRPLHLLHGNSHLRKPRPTLCHGKLSREEETEEMVEDVFFDEGEAVMEDESDEEDDDAESSVDLLFRFFQSMLKKVSKRARKASRSILPDVIPPQLVSFAVDGLLLLASLSVVKALLEVVCTLGGTVFVAILLLRLIWAAISYFQSNGNSFNQGGSPYSRTRPAT